MRPNFTPFLLPLLLLFLPGYFSFTSSGETSLLSGPTIQLETDAERHWVKLEETLTIVQFCGVTPGETYHFQLAQYHTSPGCAPVLEANPLYAGDTDLLGAYGEGLILKATSNCLNIRIVLPENCVAPYGEAMISVARQGSDPDNGNDNQLLPPAISTTSGLPAQLLVEDFLIGGDCFEVTGATAQGSAVQRGTFTNGATSIGFDSGVILSTGNTNVATGPNNQTGASTDEPNSATDPDLGQIVGAGVLNDVAVIEFDFTPTVDTIRFNYVFASEEYCDFTNSAFNDVFGFFISGPGINGPFSNNGENIAVIPGTTTPVTINNVNHTLNQPFYVGNIPAGSGQLNDPDCAGHPIAGPPSTSDCQFDGFTVSLTAEAVVIPCSTYHIKLAIADVLDGIYDSAVFFEANSLELGGETKVDAVGTIAGTNIVYEGCTGAYFEFIRDDPSDVSEDQIITYTISVASTADNGVDYVTIPVTVTIPAGQVSVQIPIDAFADGIPEGQETIILELDSPCTCSSNTIEMIIEDPPDITTPLADVTICEGEVPVNLDATATGGIPAFTYNWSSGSSGSSISVSPTSDETYYVTITDDCGNMTVDSAMVTVLPIPDATISGAGTFCENGGPQTIDLTINFTGTGPWEFVYTINGVPQAPIQTTDNPYILTVDASATYALQSVITVNGGCLGPVSGNVPITEVTLNPSLNAVDPLCNGEANGSITLVVSGGDPAYTYQWDNGAGTDQNPADLPAGTYNVTVTDANGCTETAGITINEPPLLEADIPSVQDVDCNNPGGSINLNVNGGTPGYTYNWTNGASGSNPSNLPPGTYDVTVTDANGCTDTASATIGENLTPPNAAAAADGLLTCSETSITIDGNGSSTGNEFTYSWTGPGIVSGGNTLNPEVNAPGTYTITVTNTDNGCEETATVDVGQDITPPVAVGVADPITCNNPNIIIDGNGSSTGSEFTYNWTGPGIVSGGNTLNPEVNAPGTYTLTVVNGDNGCESSTAVNVGDDTTPPAAFATGGTLTCAVTQLQISGIGSSVGPEFSYQWTTNDGNIVSGETTLTPTIDEPGTYTLDVFDASNGCENTVSVQVGLDVTPPAIDAGSPQEINCANPTVTLNGSSNPSIGITYNWTTSNGNIVANGNSANPIVDQPGTYTLTVVDQSNGCSATDDVEVTEDVELPDVAIAPADLINCYVPEITLDGTGSSTGNDFSYSWITSNGNIVSGQNTLNPVVNQPGLYTLIVSNSDNFCSNQLSVVVPADLALPVASAGPTFEITCTQTEVMLFGVGSSMGPEFTYSWSTTDGNILSGADSTTPLVNEPGTYTITVQNTINGCENSASVEVTVDENVPQADAGDNEVIDCISTLVSLDGTNSSTGPNVSYQWVTANGNIVSGANTLTPLVDQEGTYELQVTNSANGCVAFSTAIVIEDNEIPVVDIIPPGIISCDEPLMILDASNSTVGNNLSYVWVTSGGNIVDGQGTLTPTIDAGGLYTLVISNPDNFCSNSGSVNVADITDDPIISVLDPETITCGVSSVQIDGSNSENGPNFTTTWATSDGNIISGTNGLTPVVDQPGTYTLTIFDNTNNCFSEEEVIVPADLDDPIIDAGPGNELNCGVTELLLNGSASGGPNLAYQWTTQDGNILSGTTVLNPLIDAPGTYILEVLNQDNECSSVDDVIVTEDVILPNVEPGPGSEINCYQLSYQLDGTSSDQGGNYSYQWTTPDGNILSGADGLVPVVDAGGVYTLTILNQDNQCIDSSAVNIAEDLILPNSDAGAENTINCYALELNLDGSSSEQGPEISYSWNTTDGNIITGADGLNPLIDQPGTYEITVLNTDNGCETSDQVLININLTEPIVNAGLGGELTCTNSTIQLQGDAQGNTTGFVFDWETVDGNILTGEDALDPVVDAPGTYTLVVTDLDNGCSANSDVVVTQDANVPIALVSPDSALNCVNNLVQLDGTASTQSPTISFEWQVAGGGNIVSGDNTLTPSIDAPGTYTLIITDSANDCVDQTTVNIEPDTLHPQIALVPPVILTCDILEQNLDAQISSSSGNLNIIWQTSDGNIVSGDDLTNPLIDAPGTYQVEVVDNINGCISNAEIDVLEDVIFPVVGAEDPGILTCDVLTLDLEGSYDTGGVGVDIQWATSDGNILSGDTTLQPTIDTPGSYELTVSNVVNGCTSQIQVDVDQDIIDPTVEAGATDILNCTVQELTLNGTASSTGLPFEYSWTSPDGNILSGSNSLEPMIDEPGLYYLEILNTENGCTELDSVLIDQDIVDPVVDAGDPGLLTCAITEWQLSASGDNGPSFDYTWNSLDGNILSGGDGASPLVDEPGTYVLEIFNNINGCSTSDTVEVSEDVILPSVIINPANLLTCAVTEIDLSGLGSSGGTEFNYSWSTSDGNILNGSAGLEPTVNEPGTYILEIINQDNGCVNQADITVDQDIVSPTADAGVTATLTCEVQGLDLDGSGSSQGGIYEYQWTTTDGNIVSGDQSLQPEVNEPGTYQILVTNTENGCINDALVTIDQDTIAPTIVLGAPAILTCDLTEQTLDASASNTGVFTWMTNDGNIVLGEETNAPLVDAPGTYEVVLVNPENGCVSTDQVEVTQNVIFPEADAGPEAEITCLITNLNLSGSATGNSNDLSIEWTTTDGNIISGNNSTDPLIDAPGTYQITVTDLENGCATFDEVVVIPNNVDPTVVAADPQLLTCAVELIPLNGIGSETGPDIVYNWTTSNGSIIGDPANLQIETDAPGTYTLTVLNSYTGCSDLIEVEVEQDIEDPVVDAGDQGILPCNEDFVNLAGSASAGSPSLSYSWTTADGAIQSGAQSLNPAVTSAGMYQLTVTNLENGCSSTDLTDVIEIRPEEALWETLSPLCVDDYGVLVAAEVVGGTPPYSYSIDGGSNYTTSNIFQPLDPGLYDVVVQDALGCLVQGDEIIFQPQEVLVDLEPRVELQFGDSYQLQALTNLNPDQIGSISWTNGSSLSCDDCLNPVATPQVTTEYEVAITDLNGCLAEGRILLVVDRTPAVYIPNVFSPDGDGNNDLFMIFAKEGTIEQIQTFLVFSRWGETVYEYYNFLPNDPAAGWNGNHRGQPLNPAVFAYYAIIEFTDGRVEIFKGDVTLVR